MCSARARSRKSLVLLALALGWLWAAGASADEASFGFRVTVLHATSSGAVDEGAGRFDRLLRKRVSYQGLRVVSSKGQTVGANRIGSVKLPDGTLFRFRPIDPEGPGALVAIDMGGTRGDFRLPAGKPLILGGAAWQQGHLVVVLELTE